MTVNFVVKKLKGENEYVQYNYCNRSETRY